MNQNDEECQSHIITASNVEKRKLSFKGWEKCVEAFSQGKGSLSHHCSRIMGHLDSTIHEEEEISWSSSDSDDGECSQLSRHRLNRTLTSCINFDDCISGRSKGRRQTHARFSRFIEKRLGDVSFMLSDLNQSMDFNAQDSRVGKKNSQSVLPDSQVENVNPNSETENTNILNQRLQSFDESTGFLEESKEVSHSIKTPEKTSDALCLVVSPVLETRRTVRSVKRTRQKQPPTVPSDKEVILINNTCKNFESFTELTVSPPLKSTTHIRKGKPKSLYQQRVGSLKRNHHSGCGSLSNLPIQTTQSFIHNQKWPETHEKLPVSTCRTPQKELRKISCHFSNSVLGGQSSSEHGNEITSPVFGNRARGVRKKRPQSVGSCITTSPILCRLKTPAPFIKRKKLHREREEKVEEQETVCAVGDNISETEASPSLLLPRWHLSVCESSNSTKDPKSSEKVESSVKRSLNFSISHDADASGRSQAITSSSDPVKIIEHRGNEEQNCVHNVDLVWDGFNPSDKLNVSIIASDRSETASGINVPRDSFGRCQSSQQTGDSAGITLISRVDDEKCAKNVEHFEQSELIEDANTEQFLVDNIFANPAPVTILPHKKRKKLSLGKKKIEKVIQGVENIRHLTLPSTSGNVNLLNQTSVIDDSETQNWIATTSRTGNLISEDDEREKSSLVVPVEVQKYPLPRDTTLDFTNRIEEVSTESLDPPLCRSFGTVKDLGPMKIQQGLNSEVNKKGEATWQKEGLELKSIKNMITNNRLLQEDGAQNSFGLVTENVISQSSTNSREELHVQSLHSTGSVAVRQSPDQEFEHIESDSSQSAENSPLVAQIEMDRWMPSPLIISQSSSPVAENKSPLSLEPDEYNAPPKKGRKKLKPGGLASRLQKLLNRQRSSLRVWQYKRSKIRLAGVEQTSNNSIKENGTILNIDQAWTEYSHVVLQCHPVQGDGMPETTVGNALSGNVILILDSYVVEKLSRIMTTSMIQIFPPWQALKLRSATVILSASFVEVVSSSTHQTDGAHNQHPMLEILQEFSCACLKGTGEPCSVAPGLWIDGVPEGGSTKLLDFLFSDEKHDSARLLSCLRNSHTGLVAGLNVKSVTYLRDTVAQLVNNHCLGQGTLGWLSVTVLRIFQYWQVPPASGDMNPTDAMPTWSILGQDSSGELCEVVLEPNKCSEGEIITELEKGEAVGRTYRLGGLIPIQRVSPFRLSGLWHIVLTISSLEQCEQTVLYVMAPAHDSYPCALIGAENNQNVNSWQPNISVLKDIGSEDRSSDLHRTSTVCRLLHVSTNRLYVTDTQLNPRVKVIVVKPTAYVPPDVRKAKLVLLVDLEICSGEIRADKYSRFLAVDPDNLHKYCPFSEEHCRRLASLNPPLQSLSSGSTSHTLVMFSGTIVGVDEESAFMWPACGTCGNELLSVTDTQEESYHCPKCISSCQQLTLRMSLQVIAACPNLPPEYVVRIKLLQETIENLLPPIPSGDEGYEMNAVLGRLLGPLRCEVVSSKGSNFTLQELPLW